MEELSDARASSKLYRNMKVSIEAVPSNADSKGCGIGPPINDSDRGLAGC